MHPLAVREQARALRASGMTIKDVAAHLGVPVGTLHPWIRDIPGPPRELWRPSTRITKGALHDRKVAEIAECDAWGRDRVAALSRDAHFAAGVALYVGEGHKRDGCVAFTNTNPAVICYFMQWLRAHFLVDESRLRVHLYLHEGLDLGGAMDFWSRLTRIPASQFGKPYRAVPDPTIRLARHQTGCVTVKYACSRTHRMIMALSRALISSMPFDPA